MEPYEKLANAIVMQAVKDYRIALIYLKRIPNNVDYKSEVVSIEQFFRSGWYGEITNLNAEYLIRRVNEEVRRIDH